MSTVNSVEYETILNNKEQQQLANIVAKVQMQTRFVIECRNIS